MRKVFNFAIEIAGFDVALVQDVKRPDVEVGAVEHGAANYNVKTAGGVTTSDAELQMVKPIIGLGMVAEQWLLQAQNPVLGIGGLPMQYKRDIIFKEKAPNGMTLSAWIWEGAWVRKVSASNYKRGAQDENVIETITISVDRVIPLF